MIDKYERYDALDGLRVVAMFGILFMHVLANLSYRDEMKLLYRYIVYFGDFTALFMIVSAFSVNCGYFKRVINGSFSDIEYFYRKRYRKLFPFFAILTVAEVVSSFSYSSIYEGIANFTMVFGLIPHEHMTTVGVGWTLGVIFVFYLLYPFFAFCMKDKKRFTLMFIASIFFAFIGNEYFGLGKVDFLYCAIYFTSGCALYLYRHYVEKLDWRIALGLVLCTGVLFFYFIKMHALLKYFFMLALIIYAIVSSKRNTVLSGKLMKRISGLSFEIYLCHMFAYRLLEKLNLTRPFNNPYLSYVLVSIVVFVVSCGVAYGFKRIENKVVTRR